MTGKKKRNASHTASATNVQGPTPQKVKILSLFQIDFLRISVDQLQSYAAIAKL